MSLETQVKMKLSKLYLLAISFAALAVSSAGTASAADYCSKDGQRILLYVDRTTTYDEPDVENFVSGVEVIFSSLKIGDELIVHTIEDSYAQSQQIFKGCYPGCPDNGFLDNLISGCSSVRARADKNSFQVRLVQGVKALLREKASSSHSSIADTIIEIFRSYSRESSVSKVYVLSDLIENSVSLPWPQAINRTTSSAVQKTLGNLPALDMQGAKVIIFGFGRFHNKDRRTLSSNERRKLIAYWEALFERSGASSVGIYSSLN